MSLYIWHYYLIIPTAALAAANSVRTQLDNPDQVDNTFRRYPLPDAEGVYLLPATHYAASFPATNQNNEGQPSKQRLEQLLTSNPGLSTLLWVRCKNPQHHNTPEADHGIVVASNWPAFPPGATCDWAAVTAALAP